MVSSRPERHQIGGSGAVPGASRATPRIPAPAIALVVIAALLAASLGWVDMEMQALPDPNLSGVLGKAIVVYDRNGRVLGERDPEGRYHVALKLAEMGRIAPAATPAAEDRDFYRHGAVNPVAVARALAVDVASRTAAEGGSTITEQLVKIELLGSQKTISRKVQELLLAYTLEHRFSKDQILELHLNRVYYGHGAYGIGSAAQTYFGAGTRASNLTAGQAAFLAGLLQAPAASDPFVHYDRARGRELYVLDGMVATGALSLAEARKAQAENIGQELHLDISYRTSLAPHFVDYVIASLESRLGSATVHQGGLSIYTTIDPALQKAAEAAVAGGVAQLAPSGVNNGMLLAAKPSTGEILAWVASAAYADSGIGGQYDVITSPRQPGSSFKPYVYEAALLSRRFTVDSIVHDTPQTFAGCTPMDYDNRYMGQLCLKTALDRSPNIPAIETANKVGIGAVNDLAARMGIRDKLDPSLQTAVGGSPITMFDHVQGFQVFANNGLKVPLTGVTRVVDRNGNAILTSSTRESNGQPQVMSPAEAYLMTYMLKDYQKVWNFPWNRQMASKTGTTGASTQQPTDAWVMAYNPNIVVGSWVGHTGPNGQGGTITTYGEAVGTTVMASFVNGLPAGYGDWYRQPAGLVAAKGSGDPLLPGTESLASCSNAISPSGNGGGGKSHGHGNGNGGGGGD